MCNACGFYCCASDQFSGCGCEHCEHCDHEECWPDDEDDLDDCDPLYGDDEMKVVNVGDELHQVLADALRGASIKSGELK